jgi:hypothetical protein
MDLRPINIVATFGLPPVRLQTATVENKGPAG